MKTSAIWLAMSIGVAPLLAPAAEHPAKDLLCGEIQRYLSSVEPNETYAIELYTSWSTRVEGDRVLLGAKRCEDNGYEPAKRLCGYLMEHSSTEFAGYNLKRMLNCLSPSAQLPRDLEINSGSFSISHGSSNRGVLVQLELERDQEFGGMVLHINTDGY